MMRWVFNVAALSSAAVVCYGMQSSKPRYKDLIAPIPVHGSMADKVETRLFDVQVGKVVFARELKVTEFGKLKTLTTNGVWAVVAADIAARDRTTRVGAATWLGPTGLRYQQTERFSSRSNLPPISISPGLPQRGLFLFELPPGEVEGATLVFSHAVFSALDSQGNIALDRVPLDSDGTPLSVVDVYDLDRPI